jgi:hypothetical protein
MIIDNLKIRNDLINAVENIIKYFKSKNILSIICFIDKSNNPLLFQQINISMNEKEEFIYKIKNINNPFEISNKTYNKDFIINDFKIYSGIDVSKKIIELHNFKVEPLAK